jgi:hypothetical protein
LVERHVAGRHIVADIQECPQCRLINPPTAIRCDCGYNFADQRAERPFTGGVLSTVDWIVCILLPVIGLIVGFVRSSQGKPTGTKMVLISFGVFAFWVLMRLALMAPQH